MLAGLAFLLAGVFNNVFRDPPNGIVSLSFFKRFLKYEICYSSGIPTLFSSFVSKHLMMTYLKSNERVFFMLVYWIGI